LRNCYLDTIDLKTIDSARSVDLIPITKNISVEKNGKLFQIRMDWNWNVFRKPDSLFVTRDSVWKAHPFVTNRNGIVLEFAELKPGRLKMRFDTVTFYNLSGFKQDSIEVGKSDLDPKGIVSGSVETTTDQDLIVELINSKKEVEARSEGKKFNYLVKPGKYTFQMYIDRDGDGFYTGGNKEAPRKAEPLYVHPEPVELKLGWDLENIKLEPGF